MKKSRRLLVIQGSTASGKSSLAVEVAKRLNGEIICADSRQIYDELGIGVAKPTDEQFETVQHHLFGFYSIEKNYSAGLFTNDAKCCIDEVLSRGKLPVLTGGTGFYIKSLLGEFDLPKVEPDEKLRSKLELMDNDALHSMLNGLDEVSAQNIHKNNRTRLIRAIEIVKSLDKPREHARVLKVDKYDAVFVALSASARQVLYDKINSRVLKMLADGLLGEVEGLFKQYPDNKILMSTIGYQEFKDYFDGIKSLDECAAKVQQNTRHYAKRQLSWLRTQQETNIFNIDEDDFSGIVQKTLNIVNFGV